MNSADLRYFEIIDEEQVWVDGREVRWARSIRWEDYDYGHHDRSMSSLPMMRHRGFHVPLENSLVVSTQFGTHNYCSNREPFDRSEPWQWSEQATSAEMACWWEFGEQTKVHTFDPSDLPNWTGPKEPIVTESGLLEWPDGDTVVGWVPASKWWELIEALSQVPKGEVINDRADILALVTDNVEVD